MPQKKRAPEVAHSRSHLSDARGARTASVTTDDVNYDVYTVVPGAIGNVLERHTVNMSTDSTSGSRYYQYNHRGDVIMATDSTGAMLWAQDYSAFGHIATDDHATGGANGVKDDLLITGKDWDAELGLTYFNARWYDPETGRFITETPLQPWVEGAYVYCNNNPLCYADTNGYMASMIIIIGGPAVIGGISAGVKAGILARLNGDDILGAVIPAMAEGFVSSGLYAIIAPSMGQPMAGVIAGGIGAGTREYFNQVMGGLCIDGEKIKSAASVGAVFGGISGIATYFCDKFGAKDIGNWFFPFINQGFQYVGTTIGDIIGESIPSYGPARENNRRKKEMLGSVEIIRVY